MLTHRGHRDQRPPQAQGDRAEVVGGVDLDPLGVVDKTGKDHDSEHQEEHQQHQLLGRGAKCLKEDFQTGGMASQFEQSQYSDDAEELENICIFYVRNVLLQEEVRVETDCCNVINHIHR